ncbi:unnamed protein product [Cladocopium goreaui]|uniref:Uncharacterized protein n=1 Tax=Cladocopium goreaui TaxID=2562237 RepID=A0A9P1D561_9DINO|nr:unnamed protein product [Cladocopium goreaui]
MSSHPISNPSIRRARDLSHRQAAAALLEKLKESEPDLEVRHVRLWDETLQMDYRLEHVRAKMAMLAGQASAEEVSSFGHLERLCAELV